MLKEKKSINSYKFREPWKHLLQEQLFSFFSMCMLKHVQQNKEERTKKIKHVYFIGSITRAGCFEQVEFSRILEEAE